jgi:hypothetical protein
MAGRASIVKGQRVSRSDGLRAFVLVIAIACVPVVGTVLAIVTTTEPDLSDLKPIRQLQGRYVLLDWLALGHGQFSAAAAVQALGYMLENDRSVHTGEWVRDFIMLPEAGNILHPAHRIPDQMIAVRLGEGEQIQFAPRSLVWVWGTFRASPADPAGIQPRYLLDQAKAKRAANSETSTYFR